LSAVIEEWADAYAFFFEELGVAPSAGGK